MRAHTKAAVLVLALAGCGGPDADALRVQPDDIVLGDARAAVVLVEYASFSCDPCGAFHREVLPRFKADWLDQGRAAFVYRDFPTSDFALAVSTLARCTAGPGQQRRYQFWLDVLFRRQSEWITARDPIDAIFAFARETDFVGMDRFQVCLGDPRTEEAVLRGRAAAQKLGVRSAPAYFVNGQKLAGVPTWPVLEQALNRTTPAPAR